ncbi:acyltransferase family protein [Pseudacidovorax intermedius]|uniref:acyltransferase family protein n=1 Tax=Pseudacidovorax intermedius TaxID=433924 RepID=UPI00034DE057|nr:acyltransferase [Pseudacidovorax intermedius]
MNPAAGGRAPPPRWPLIDALKALACLLIVAHHFSRYGPLPVAAWPLAPTLFEVLAREGRLAVQVFLVLGGFLTAASLAPEGELRAGHPGLRLVQRYVRLASPYLAALVACVLVEALVRPALPGDDVPGQPSLVQMVAHALLLQDLLNQPALSTGVWYVAVDFQLYGLALLLFWVAALWRRQGRLDVKVARALTVLMVAGLTSTSLVVFNRHSVLDETGLYFFGSYGLGMLAFWAGRLRARRGRIAALLVLALLGGVALWIDWRSRVAIALIASLFLVLAQPRGWLAVQVWSPLQRMGAWSYALFLIHFPVLLLVSASAQINLEQVAPWQALGALVAAFVLSVGAARTLHERVEARATSWRMPAVWGAGLLLSGLAVGL